MFIIRFNLPEERIGKPEAGVTVFQSVTQIKNDTKHAGAVEQYQMIYHK